MDKKEENYCRTCDSRSRGNSKEPRQMLYFLIGVIIVALLVWKFL